MSLPASRAKDFADSVGVDTHIPYTDGGYSQIANVEADLAYLGVSDLRDGISDGVNGSAPLSSFVSLAREGARFTFVASGGGDVTTADLQAQFALFDQLEAAVPGSITAIEGPNEVNNWPVVFNGVGGIDGAVAEQQAIYTAVRSDPAMAGVSVDYFTGYNAGQVPAGPDPATTAGLADFDTQHPYPNFNQAPAFWVSPSQALGNETAPYGPAVYTETGYSTDNVDADVQGVYTLNLLLDTARDGISRTYLYQLMDAYQPGSRQGDDGYGLFDPSNAPKPAAVGIHNLLGLLSDPSPSAQTFTSSALDGGITGLPATASSYVLEKADGTYELAIWDEQPLWDNSTGSEMAATSSSVTVQLGGARSVKVYDPLVSGSPVTSMASATSVRLSLSSHPLLVEIGASGAPAAPVLSQQSQDLRLAAGSAVSLTLPASIFASPDGTALSYTVSGKGGAPLPTGLTFNPVTMVLSGNAPGTAGSTEIVVQATEQAGLSAAEAFHIITSASAPVLVQQTDDVRLPGGAGINFSLPSGAFADPLGGTVSYSASQVDGTSLPGWLSFNPATGAFTGTVPAAATPLGVVVTATTSEGGRNAEAFKIIGQAPAPVLAVQTQDVRATAGQAVSVSVPGNAFTDPAGGSLTYSVKGADGSILPPWLSFNAATGTLSGVSPVAGSASSIGVEVDAVSSEGGAAAEAFRVYLAPAAPTLAMQTPDQRLSVNQAFSFTLPSGTFAEAAGGTVAVSARQPDGSPLPSWISFDAATGIFSGTAPSAAGSFGIVVTGTNTAGAGAGEAFHIITSAPAPVLQAQQGDVRTSTGSTVSVTLPAGSFTDPAGGTVTLAATQPDGSPLPGWLQFNAATGTFSGVAPTASGRVGAMVTATTSEGGTAAEAFKVIYTAPPVVGQVVAISSLTQSGGDPTIQVTGTAASNVSRVEVFAGAADLGAATLSAGAWTFNSAATFNGLYGPSSLETGSYSIRAVSTDGAGASGTASATIVMKDNVTATVQASSVPASRLTGTYGAEGFTAETLTGQSGTGTLVPVSASGIGSNPAVLYNWQPQVQLSGFISAYQAALSGTPLISPLSIVAIGDSTTRGVGASDVGFTSLSYPSELSQALNSDGIASQTDNFLGGPLTPADVMQDYRVVYVGGASAGPTAAGGATVTTSAVGAGLDFNLNTPGAYDRVTVSYLDSSSGSMSVLAGGQAVGTLAFKGTGTVESSTFDLPSGSDYSQMSLRAETADTMDVQGVSFWNSTSPSISVEDAGIGGSTSGSDLVNGDLAGVAAMHPSLALIDLGINDFNYAIGSGGETPSQAVDDIGQMISTLRAAGSDVVLLLPHPFQLPASSGTTYDTAMSAFRAGIQSLSTSDNVGMIDLSATYSNDYSSLAAAGLMSDTLHPNATLYADMGSAMASVFASALHPA